ncbi:MAG: hypothetical protein M3257_07665 [Actinomycetota bacterium]|nr:hypothetical protein [Actinomycetota bacterium]
MVTLPRQVQYVERVSVISAALTTIGGSYKFRMLTSLIDHAVGGLPQVVSSESA